MPLLDNTMQNHVIGGTNYGYSATRIGDLGAAEFTLAVLAADTSGSVGPFIQEIEACIQSVAKACRLSPRADNLMLRVTRFDTSVEEVHGFKPLNEVNVAGYVGCLKSGGCTALNDASFNAIESVRRYGTQLAKHNFGVNGIVFVITDGCDNASSLKPAAVKQALIDSVRSEELESLTSVLIGVNLLDAHVKSSIESFAKTAGFTQYIDVGQADAKSLSRLADFVSRSISLQSRLLGSASASTLSF